MREEGAWKREEGRDVGRGRGLEGSDRLAGMAIPRERNFVHLHNHMEGSYSDSALPMLRALDKVAELEMPAFALTDHGELAMLRPFARAAADRGIRPLVGVEAYFVEDAEANIKGRVNFRHHLTILAADARGYANLIRLVTASWRDNCLMQKMGLVDWKLLEAHAEGLICLSGCLAGPVAWSFKNGDPATADRFCGRFSELFGDRYYLEVFAHGMPEEEVATKGILDLGARYGRSVVLTNDCHYLDQRDWVLHDTLIKTRFGRPTDFALPWHEYHIKPPSEMRALGFSEALCDTTLAIAERISLTADEILAGPTPADVRAAAAPAMVSPIEVVSPEADPASRSGAALLGPNRAFLGVRAPIGRALALEKAASVQNLPPGEVRALSKMTPAAVSTTYPEVWDVARRIENLPGAPMADLARVVVLESLSSRIPLRRSEEILFTMWDEADCLAVGARIEPVAEHPDLVDLAEAMNAYREALAEYRRRRHDVARARCLRAIQLRPGFLNARYQLALIDYYTSEYHQARTQFLSILEADPQFERLPHLESYLGWCHYQLHDDEAAAATFRSSLAEKTIPGSLLGLGLVEERRGDLEAAKESLLKLVQEYPDFSRQATAQRALERIMKALPPA